MKAVKNACPKRRDDRELSVPQNKRNRFKFNGETFEERMQKKEEMQRAKDLEKEILERQKEVRAARGQKIREKRERKKINELKSGEFQVIKKMTKSAKKARHAIMKMSPEMIEHHMRK